MTQILRKAVKGSLKGADFERDQARKISLWISGGKDQDLLWRSSQSGGRATAGKVKGAQYGDLWYQKHTEESEQYLTAFCTELKFYKNVDTFKAWVNEKDIFNQWWEKCEREAKKSKVYPLLVIKANRQPVVMCFESCLAEYLFYEFERMRILKLEYDITIVKQDDIFNKMLWKHLFSKLHNTNLEDKKR